MVGGLAGTRTENQSMLYCLSMTVVGRLLHGLSAAVLVAALGLPLMVPAPAPEFPAWALAPAFGVGVVGEHVLEDDLQSIRLPRRPCGHRRLANTGWWALTSLAEAATDAPEDT